MPLDGGDNSSHPYIKHILLQNFMCHENFEINLHRKLNIIYGSNGSGKSTILTALMVALGSRAKATSRSESLKSLVKTGATRSWIHVTFHVPQGYREMYRKYGSNVTVIRTITSKGVSSYSIRDCNGQKVPKAGVKEVQALCYHFGIYPENELAMLSQENAKEFLVHASLQAKYDKLQRAMLHHIITKNQEAVAVAEAEQQGLVSQMRQREHNIEISESRSQEVLNRSSEQINRKKRMNLIKNILAWREVDEAKASSDELRTDLNNAQEELNLLNNSETSNNEKARLDTRIEQLRLEIEQLDMRREELVNEASSFEAQHQDVHYSVTRIREETHMCKEDIRKYEEEISILQTNLANSSPETIEKRRKQLSKDRDNAIEQKSEAAEKRNKIEQSIQEYREQKNRHQVRLQKLVSERNDLDRNINSLKDELRELMSGKSQGNLRNPLDPKHKDLQRLVAQQRDWKQKPIGPLYQYMEMNDEGANYSPALERLWNPTLDNWWVQYEADRAKLQKLARDIAFNNLRIILRKDDVFDFASALPPESDNYKRIVDLLNIESDSIKRILVDLNHIESMVVVRGTQAAFSAVRSSQKIRNALAISTSQRGTNQFTQVTMTPMRTDSATVAPNNLVRIRVGTQARNSQIRAEIKELNSQVLSLDKSIHEIEQEVSNVDLTLQEESGRLRKLQNVERRYEEVISQASKEIMAMDTDVTPQEYEADMKRLKDLIGKKRGVIGSNEQGLIEHESTLQELSDLINNKRAEHERVANKISENRQESRSLDNKARRIVSENESRTRKITRKERLISELEQRLRVSEEFLDDKFNRAMADVGERFTNDDASDTNDYRMEDTNALQLEFRKLKNEAGVLVATDEEIENAQRDAAHAAESRIEVQKNRREMEKLSGMIEERRKYRQVNEKRAWEDIKRSVQSSFEKTLQRRKFTGTVIIDDLKRKLLIEAAPESNKSRGVSTLSGGEKSFTQVALLMSVWLTMQVGLVAMDEYDVFMDKANRSMSLRLLAETVAQQSMQCILITPQDVDVTVLETMRDNEAFEGFDYQVNKLNPVRR